MENVEFYKNALSAGQLGPSFGIYQKFWSFVTGLKNQRKRGFISKAVIATAITVFGLHQARKKLRKYRLSVELEERIRVAKTPQCADSTAEATVPLGEIHPCPPNNLPKSMRLVVTVDPLDSSRYLKVCNAVRIGDHLVLPAHAVSQVDHFFVVEGRGSKNYIRVETSILTEITTDLLAGKLAPDLFSRIGMAQVKLAEYSGPTMVTAYSCVATREPPADGYSSVGMLYPDAGFGYMQFGGSTRPGFSGGLYQTGTRSYAIHMRRGPPGAVYNLGLSLAYVQCLLEGVSDGEGESTEEYILNLAKRKDKRLSYQKEEDGGYIFRVGDRYLRVSADRYWELYQEDPDSTQFDPRPKQEEGEAALDEPVVADRVIEQPVPAPRTTITVASVVPPTPVGAERNSWECERSGLLSTISALTARLDDMEQLLDVDEAASDIVMGGGYVGDQIAPRPRIDEKVFSDYFLGQRPLGADYTVPGALIKNSGLTTVEPVRVMNQDVIARIREKADAVSLQKQMQEARTVLLNKIQQCVERFRIAGGDVAAHGLVYAEYSQHLQELDVINSHLKDANVTVTQASAQTVEEKKAAKAAARKRYKERQRVAKAGASLPVMQAVVREHTDVELEAVIPQNSAPVPVKRPVDASVKGESSKLQAAPVEKKAESKPQAKKRPSS